MELTLPLNKTELHIILQGVTALQSETVAHRNVMVQRLAPGDNNVVTLLEYYDKRSGQLQAIQKKITGLVNSP